MKYVLYKVKKDKLDQWNDWCKELGSTYREEALKTLKEENVLFEGFTTFSAGDDFYTMGFSLEGPGGEKPVNKENELNQKHSAVKRECLEFVSKDVANYFIP